MGRPAVFIDRDGTLIEDADFLTSADQIRILPRTIPALRKLHEAGYAVVVVTNQSAVARGMLSEDELRAIHDRLVELVETLGGHVDAVYYCPHLPEGSVPQYAVECECRKPKPGLLFRARDEMDLDLSRSFAVGDAWRDVEAALAADVPSVKLPRPAAREEPPRPDLPVLGEATTLEGAAEMILGTTPEKARDALREARDRAARRAAASAPPRPEGPAPAGSQSEVTTMASETRSADRDADEQAEQPAAETETTEEQEAEFDASLAPSPELERLERAPSRTAAEPEEEPDDGAAVPLFGKQLEAAVEEEEEEEEQEAGLEEREEELAPAARDEAVGERDEIEEPEEAETEEVPSPWTCGRCGAAVDEADVAAGSAGEVYGSLLCRECYPEVRRMANHSARRLDSEAVPAGVGDRDEALAAILTELRRLSRRSADDAFDLARVLALVAQTLALGFAVAMPIFRGSWAEAPVWLLAAIFAQLFALTMFIVSRRKD